MKLGTSLLAVLMVGCTANEKSSINVNNDEPQLSIVSPADESSVDEYDLVEFRGMATDLEDDETDIQITWESGTDGVLNVDSPDAEGNVYFATDALTPGNHVITLTATDTQGLSSSVSMRLEVVDELDEPTIEIRNPSEGEIGEEGVATTFAALVGDVQDAPQDLMVSFASDLDGEFCVPTPDDIGFAACEAVLSVGEHMLLFAVADSHEFTAFAELTYVVLPGTQVDNDSDGYTEEEGDCDDTQSTISPDGVEVINQLDDDCDGIIDEETDAYDDDGDGFSEQDGDCDDTNGDAYPGGEEEVNGIDDNCDGIIDNNTIIFDDDGDGFSEEEGDCDDAEAATYPGNTEVADGLDNDCDTYIDEGTPFFDDDGDCYCESLPCYGSVNANCAAAQLTDGDCDDNDVNTSPDLVWYADFDGDLRGNPSNSTASCNQPLSYVSNADDCDDTNVYAWTGNPESCDGYDNDCDGSVDEGVTNTYYQDLDGDLYGSNTVTTEACSAPANYVSIAGDCNDSNATAHVGATETCDGIDNDCDGDSDEQNASGCIDYYQDIDNDTYGTSASICACEPEGNYTATRPGDCFDDGVNAAITHPNANYSGVSSPRGDTGTYDFDCDGVVEKENTSLAACYGGSLGLSSCSTGWYSQSSLTGGLNGTVPSCGVSGTLAYSCNANSWYQACSYSTYSNSVTQRCR